MISVIVPIFNVEAYLPKCLDSLAAQTFTDVEFILIDDGSTDRSGEIADQYSDTRFRVFHTANRGLSAARNYGIERSHGEWLMFVDSDDWVEPTYCEIPYKAAVSNDADLVIFQAYGMKNGKVRNGKNAALTGIVNTEDALKNCGTAVWNKLYKRTLFDVIRFPEDMIFEDIAVTHKIVLQARRIVILPDVLYYYVYRKGSLSQCFSLKNKRDAFAAALQRAEDLKSLGFAKETYEPKLVSYAITMLIISNPGNDPLYMKAEEIVDSCKNVPPWLTLKKKVMLMVWKVNKRFFQIICRVLTERHMHTAIPSENTAPGSSKK